MKFNILLSILLFHGYFFAQKETNQWVIPPASIIDFNSTSPSVIPNSTLAYDYIEASSCIADKNGSLLFYTDGDTIRNRFNQILPNGGEDLSILNSNDLGIRSATQGALTTPVPGSDSLYYVFTLGNHDFFYNSGYLSYSVIDVTANGGIGNVVSKANFLFNDTLSEKMTLANHCNNTNKWLILIKYKNAKITDGQIIKPVYDFDFLCFLVSKNEVSPFPIKSSFSGILCPAFGQMKLNNAQNQLAFGDNFTLNTFNFDNSTGKITLNKQYKNTFTNAYGLEYSPNDSLIYIGNSQFNLHTEELTILYPKFRNLQLQRASNGKIYGPRLDSNEFFYNAPDFSFFWSFNSGGVHLSNSETVEYFFSIEQPNISGIGCNYKDTAIIVPFTQPDIRTYCLPYFPSYLFNIKKSDFHYNGTCTNESFNFWFEENSGIDSAFWQFSDDNSIQSGLNVQHIFLNQGSYSVTTTVYSNGTTSISTQCVDVCGSESIDLPKQIDLCKVEPFEINCINTCESEYLWNTGDTSPVLYVNKTGEYILKSSNSCGVFFDTINVFESDDCAAIINMPNVFTPNTDGSNDYFTIEIKNIQQINYSILNRWGGVVFSNKIDVNQSAVFSLTNLSVWDGNDQFGNPLNEGVYYLQIDALTVKNELKRNNSFISLFR